MLNPQNVDYKKCCIIICRDGLEEGGEKYKKIEAGLGCQHTHARLNFEK